MAKRIGPLLLRVVMEEPRPEVRQEIHALVLLVNTSLVDLTVSSLFQVNKKTLPYEIALTLKRGRHELEFLPKIRVDPTAFEFQQLKPGASIGKRIRLSHYFEIAKGAYRLVATYRNREDPPDRPGIVAWKGELTAETRFSVV
jgi:hypothetical protein